MAKIVTIPLAPKSATASFKKIKEVIDMGWMEIPNEKSFGGTGAPGRVIEHLLSIKENNADSPDLNDWEVKFHGGNALLTLFHKEPQPRGIVKYLVNSHGWKDDHGRTSFRHTFAGRSERGFYAVNEIDRLVVRHENSPDMPMVYWLHNTLLNHVGAKLRRLIVVDGIVEQHPIRRVKFNKATAYWDFQLTDFCESVASGKVYIDFDARTQLTGTGLRNHGTKFRVNVNDISNFYAHSKKIT